MVGWWGACSYSSGESAAKQSETELERGEISRGQSRYMPSSNRATGHIFLFVVVVALRKIHVIIAPR